jgi:hypothetical protein
VIDVCGVLINLRTAIMRYRKPKTLDKFFRWAIWHLSSCLAGQPFCLHWCVPALWLVSPNALLRCPARRPELQARHTAFQRGSAYLERYCMLIAFTAYLELCQKRGRRLTFEVGRNCSLTRVWEDCVRRLACLPAAVTFGGGWRQISETDIGS